MALINRIASTFVPVKDQDAAIDFYTGKLGFEKTVDVPYGGNDRWVEVALPGAESALALVVPPEGRPIETSVVGLSTGEIDAAYASLQEKGIDVGELMRMQPPVPPMFSFDDPDGNHFWVVGAP